MVRAAYRGALSFRILSAVVSLVFLLSFTGVGYAVPAVTSQVEETQAVAPPAEPAVAEAPAEEQAPAVVEAPAQEQAPAVVEAPAEAQPAEAAPAETPVATDAAPAESPAPQAEVKPEVEAAQTPAPDAAAPADTSPATTAPLALKRKIDPLAKFGPVAGVFAPLAAGPALTVAKYVGPASNPFLYYNAPYKTVGGVEVEWVLRVTNQSASVVATNVSLTFVPDLANSDALPAGGLSTTTTSASVVRSSRVIRSCGPACRYRQAGTSTSTSAARLRTFTGTTGLKRRPSTPPRRPRPIRMPMTPDST